MNTPEQATAFIPLDVVGFSGNETVSCGDCVSACCRQGVAMPLTPSEVATMTAAGTELEKIDNLPYGARLSIKERWQKKAYYLLQSDCGNLEVSEYGGPGICKVFDGPERPAICGEFKVGSFCCQVMRDANEVTTVDLMSASA